jgi:DNA polymerase-3 subunit epsilon
MQFVEILSQKINDAAFSVLDVETTGLSSSYNNVIEIGIVKVQNKKIIDTYHSLINPARDIPYFITQFTGITNDDVYDAPMFDEIFNNVLEFLDDTILVAHNLPFDISFLRKEFKLCGIERFNPPQLCTLKLARRMFPELKSKSLASVTNFMRVHNDFAHRALSDADVTARILIKMLNKLKIDEGFSTIEEVINHQFNLNSKIKRKVVSKKLSGQFAALPNAPGIYYFLNSKNEIIYIGKAKSLRDRIKSYLSDSASRKTKKILKQAYKIKTEVTNSELTALLAEAEAIKVFNPKLNVQLKQYNNKYFLKITKTHTAPTAEITNKFDFDGNDYFGLFISRKKTEQIKDLIDKIFLLRECKEKDFNKHKICFLSEIERCTAPCINPNDELYKQELEKVYEFMYGKNQFALNRMINKMKTYSEQMKFEKAAEIKEVINLILAQIHKTSLLSEPVNLANVLIEITEYIGSKDYLLLLEGKTFIKKNILNKDDEFDKALNDYFERTRQIDIFPTEEDLEKMKIALNWIIKNRNKVHIYYLKEYSTKENLFEKISMQYYHSPVETESFFNIKKFIN